MKYRRLKMDPIKCGGGGPGFHYGIYEEVPLDTPELKFASYRGKHTFGWTVYAQLEMQLTTPFIPLV
jgi:hypothetical protein